MSTSTGKRQNWKQQQKSSNTASTTTSIPIRSSQTPTFIRDERILSKPPNEKVIAGESKFPLPDKAKENELTRLQIQIQDLHKSGNYARALTLSDTLVKDTISHFGSKHPATAAAYNNLGLMRKLQGQFDEARLDYTKAQEIYREVLGNDHASYANTLHNLGNLNRTQVHLDTTLTATDRLSLVESALRYLEDAYNIRLAELGPVHPHTVSSRSSWGATLAAQILHHHKMTSALSKGGDLMRQRFYVSILPTDVTETAWTAAEEHLREALTTAIDNPRGLTIAKATTASNNAPPQRGKRKMKPAPKMEDVLSAAQSPQTLSAASAAQNLAVFLKARATTVQPYEMKWLEEAESLYRQALKVQTVLLPKGKVSNKKEQLHPDMYATKHSLAEVLEAMGQTDAANVIRQEILDTLDPPSMESSITTKNEEANESLSSSDSKNDIVDDDLHTKSKTDDDGDDTVVTDNSIGTDHKKDDEEDHSTSLGITSTPVAATTTSTVTTLI
jgi:tetratricopeptide (TPR) repeat protein